MEERGKKKSTTKKKMGDELRTSQIPIFCTESSRSTCPTPSATPLVPRRVPKSSMAGLCFRCMANYLAEGNLSGFQGYLENRHVQIDDRDENGQSVLMLAAQKGQRDFVLELLNYGADVNAVDYDNWNALLNAAKEGHVDIAKEFLDHNAILEHKDMGGWTALMWACYKGRLQTVKLLLERGAEPNVHGQYHISCLMWAAGRGYTEIVQQLLSYGAKVNVGDKYGTSALIWASRKGDLEIVEDLLKAGANVDTVGMYLWTPLLVATMGNFIEIVQVLLDCKPNVNALDKDGYTALTVACKEGFTDIVVALLNAGAYVNVQDRAGDTNLIHAAKAGNLEAAEALIKKYADVDVQGTDKKTALYWAVEKNYVDIVKAILRANPDTEFPTKDGDTPLMKATRNRNTEIVQMLLDKKCKVSSVDKKGDTALHIAMRSRSKAIVEILLRNPKNSQILYRPNRAGETPYNIDSSHQKSILGQIFGARRLNTNEDNENMLGYDLYSSALADFLSEPTLSMPICVGLYAKWGSGKSFLLNKLQVEMMNFARQWVEPELAFSSLLFLLVIHIAAFFGITLGLILMNWVVAAAVAVGTFLLLYVFLAAVWLGIHRYDMDYAHVISTYLARKLSNVKLFLMVLFCYPSTNNKEEQINPIRFLFTDQAKVSSTGSENSVAFMIASLYEAMEQEYGVMTTRLYTVFKPKPVSASSWKWRRICCIPNFLIFYATFACILVGVILFVTHDVGLFRTSDKIFSDERAPIHGAIIALITVISVIVVANLYTWIRMLSVLVYPTTKRLFRSIAKAQAFKMDDLQAQHAYSQLLTEMVQCLDGFTGNQTRLVIVVDGLDSCEQEKVLHNLDAVHVLFSDPSSPFITILAIDPHIIIKAIETNINRVFNDLNVNGHDYLRNIVHLPFYLQNSGMRRVRVAQHIAAKKMGHWGNDERESFSFGSTFGMSSRRFSSESSMSIPDRFKQSSRKNSKKLKMSESVASSMGNINSRVTGAQDLTKVLLTDDYFSDVNPRSMRRLMNVVYITGRLMKAFNIDFNWYHLATWVNITEQWPYRTSWITLYFEKNEDISEDNMSLKSIYDKLCDQIPTSKEQEPYLEIDRDERKFEIFLSYHKASLQIADLKMFLPFTINLDPYIRKVIKEERQNQEDLNASSVISVVPQQPMTGIPGWPNLENKNVSRKISRSSSSQRVQPYSSGQIMYPMPPQMAPGMPPVVWNPYPSTSHSIISNSNSDMSLFRTALPPNMSDVVLSRLTVDEVIELLKKLEGFNNALMPKYCATLRENNISGRVLFYCDLDELKKVLFMSFGDWELFRVAILSLREQEMIGLDTGDGDAHKNVHFSVQPKVAQTQSQQTSATQTASAAVKSPREPPIVKSTTTRPSGENSDKGNRDRSSSTKRIGQQNTLEKQVTLEEQMIMGALQTLSEEAQEDARESMTMQEAVPPPSVSTLSPILSDPDEAMDGLSDAGSVLSSVCLDHRETDVLFIHTPPMSPRNQHSASFGPYEERLFSPKRIQVLSNAEHLPLSPSPTQRPRFSLTSISSSQASGIDTLDFDDMDTNLGSSMPSMKPNRPSNLGVTPVASFERLNKLKNKIISVVSPSRSNSPVPSLIKKKAPEPREEPLKRNQTPSSSDNDLSESTPLVSPLKAFRPEPKTVLRSDALTLTAPMAGSSSGKESVSRPNSIISISSSEHGNKKLSPAQAVSFDQASPTPHRKKLCRSSVSFSETKCQSIDSNKFLSSDMDLKNSVVMKDGHSSSVPATPTTAVDSQLIEVVTSTETVL